MYYNNYFHYYYYYYYMYLVFHWILIKWDDAIGKVVLSDRRYSLLIQINSLTILLQVWFVFLSKNTTNSHPPSYEFIINIFL